MPEKLLTTKETENWLDVSHDSLRRWRQRKFDPLPAMKGGKEWRYSASRVMAWLERQGKSQSATR